MFEFMFMFGLECFRLTYHSKRALRKHRSFLITPHLKATWFKLSQCKPAKHSGNLSQKARSCLSNVCVSLFFCNSHKRMNKSVNKTRPNDHSSFQIRILPISLMCNPVTIFGSIQKLFGFQVSKGSDASGVSSTANGRRGPTEYYTHRAQEELRPQ